MCALVAVSSLLLLSRFLKRLTSMVRILTHSLASYGSLSRFHAAPSRIQNPMDVQIPMCSSCHVEDSVAQLSPSGAPSHDLILHGISRSFFLTRTVSRCSVTTA